MKILTLNVWGAPYAKHRTERIDAICDEVKRISPDILLFQEVYFKNNRTQLIDGLKDNWQHYHYYPSAWVGSGLLTFSKYPIVDTAFFKFRMQGKPEDVMRGDYYAGKGIGLARIDTPHGIVDVYNCHTHAQYDPDNDNEYAVYSETNLYDASRFIDSYSGASPVILCGDLNTRPDQIGYDIITQLGHLVDTAYHLNGTYPITFDSNNPYSRSVDQCLDYILVRNVAVEAIGVTMDEGLHDGIAPRYSDHYGLLAEFNLIGEKLYPSQHNNARHVLETLHKRVRDDALDTNSEQVSHWEKSLLGLGSVVDGFLFSGFIRRYSDIWARRIRWLGVIVAIAFSLFNVIQAGLNLRNRKNTLDGIQAELETQLKANRLFDGREL